MKKYSYVIFIVITMVIIIVLSLYTLYMPHGFKQNIGGLQVYLNYKEKFPVIQINNENLRINRIVSKQTYNYHYNTVVTDKDGFPMPLYSSTPNMYKRFLDKISDINDFHVIFDTPSPPLVFSIGIVYSSDSLTDKSFFSGQPLIYELEIDALTCQFSKEYKIYESQHGSTFFNEYTVDPEIKLLTEGCIFYIDSNFNYKVWHPFKEGFRLIYTKKLSKESLPHQLEFVLQMGSYY